MTHIVIYKWYTRADFLLQRLFPDAQIIEANPRSDDQRILTIARQIAATHQGQSLHWFFQLNLSYCEHWLSEPQQTLAALAELGFKVHNGRVLDSRKKRIQSLNQSLGLNTVALEQPVNPELPVMVKSNHNYGGEFERLLSEPMRQALGLGAVNDSPIQQFDEYYQTSAAQVPAQLWDDDNLVIERYIENKQDHFYRFYRCLDYGVLSQITNPQMIKKMTPGLPRQNWLVELTSTQTYPFQALIDSANLMMTTMNMSFGAIDLVMDDQGKAYIIDVNPTPGWGKEKQTEVLDFLRQGVVETQSCHSVY